MSTHILQAIADISQHNAPFYTDELTTYNSIRIRILGINPGSFEDPLCCRLRSLAIPKHLGFGALSYAWGSEAGEQEITINDQPGFKVTTSVAGALRRLRHHDRVRCLWVDAICVNQANTRERSQQVALMAEIFSSAELVYVWLGECTGTATNFRKVELEDREICRVHVVEWDGTFRQAVPTMAAVATSAALCEVRSGRWQWWWRTWAVQEVGLGRKVAVMIGPHQFSWQKAREALSHCWTQAMSNWLAQQRLHSIVRRIINLSRSTQFEQSEAGSLITFDIFLT